MELTGEIYTTVYLKQNLCFVLDGSDQIKPNRITAPKGREREVEDRILVHVLM